MNDCDWMAGESAEECLLEYKANFTGNYDGDEPLAPLELTEEEMKTLRFQDNDLFPAVSRSFGKQLQNMIKNGEKFPTFFASTEY